MHRSDGQTSMMVRNLSMLLPNTKNEERYNFIFELLVSQIDIAITTII